VGYLLNRLGQMLSETSPETGPSEQFAADVRPPSRQTAARVTVERALGLPAFYRGVEILAGVASGLAIDAVRGGAIVTPTPSLIAKPDPWREREDWIERYVVSMVCDGNTFLRKLRSGTSVYATEILNPFLTHVRWTKGIKSYTTFDHRLGRFIDLADADVYHSWGLQIPGRTRGLGPIEANRISLGGHLDVRDFAAEWFQKSDVPSGILSSDQALDPASVAMYRKIWHDPAVFDDQPDAATLNRRLGPEIRVLGKGLNYVPIMLKPADAQWIEAQNFGVLDIARMLGLPADWLHAAVESKSLTYKSLEMLDTQTMRITFRPKYLSKIERALTAVSPIGQSAQFDLSEWLRPDAETQARIDRIYLDTGVVSEQDVRDRLRLSGTAPGRPASQTPAPAPEPDTEDAPA
jgi:HK97 family phage portal protein